MTFEDQMASRAASDYADFLLPHLDTKTHVLDLGCGDGALTVGLAVLCDRVTALDLSADEFHGAAAASRGIGNVNFVRGDVTQLPFPDRSFDAVLAHSVLESGVEPARLLAEAWRVLRPGGRLGVATAEAVMSGRGCSWPKRHSRRKDTPPDRGDRDLFSHCLSVTDRVSDVLESSGALQAVPAPGLARRWSED